MSSNRNISNLYKDFRNKTLEEIIIEMKELKAGSYSIKLCGEGGDVMAGIVILNGRCANAISEGIDNLIDDIL